MKAGFRIKNIKRISIFLSSLFIATNASAAAFQLWEQDGASIGNYHAGYAAAAEDASTAFYNPAGLTRFDNQQLVLAGTNVLTNFKYKGTVNVNTIVITDPTVTAQGGGYALVPALHFVAPLTKALAFGFSVVAPFGLMTNYGSDTILQYAATTTSILTVDASPDLALKINRHWSVGAGPDIQYAKGEFDQVGVTLLSELYADGTNKVDNTGYGFHGGVLYEHDENTRVGLSYHSKVRHRMTGTSRLDGPLANIIAGGTITSNTAYIDITLPAYTALSVFHRQNKFAFMGSAIYTQWNMIRELILHNVAGIDASNQAGFLTITTPQFFRNTWNLTAGANYYVTDTVTLRAGLGFDQTPTSDRYRNVQLPDSDRYVVSLGSKFKLSKTLAVDLAWMHLFAGTPKINPPAQVVGRERVTTNGKVTGGADVFGAQVTWDLA